MSSKEYMGWIQYFKERPFGWREDHRTAILTQTTYQGKKKINVNDFFPSLKLLTDSLKKKEEYLQNNPFIVKLKQVAAKNKIKWLEIKKD